MVSGADAKDRKTDELLRRVLRGDTLAWTEFFSTHAPTVDRLIRSSRSMGSYRDSVDDCRSAMAQVFERLRREDFRALRTFAAWREKNAGKGFSDWLTIVTINVVRDYVTAKLGTPGEDGASVKQMVNTWADALPIGDGEPLALPHITTKQTARQILEFARAHLPDDQLAALGGWLAGDSFEEIASELGGADAKVAERLVRAALARLRRQFAPAT